jgi:RNA polymerase sigma-70 factor (ECF subfamily)
MGSRCYFEKLIGYGGFLNRAPGVATLGELVLTPIRQPKADTSRRDRSGAAAPARDRRESTVRELRPGLVANVTSGGATDAEIAVALRGDAGDADARRSNAAVMLFDRHARHVERLLFSLLGPEPDAEDLLHEVFLRAIEGIRDLEEPGKLRSWLTGISVHTAREHIRKRVRRRWLSFVADIPEPPPVHVRVASEEVTEATRCTFEVLGGMSADDRVVFSLRFIEGLEMGEIAVACDVSLSTAKRRLKDAERHFLNRARRFPALAPWIEEGGRWATP